MKNSIRHYYKTLVTIIVIISIMALSGAVSNLSVSGHWEGKIELPGTPLAINIDFISENSKPISGTISIPLQKISDFPLAQIVFTEKKIRFILPDIPGDAYFEGKLSNDGNKIKGLYYQSQNSYPFEIARSESPYTKAVKSLEGLDNFVSRVIKEWNVPGVGIGIVYKNKVIYNKGFGCRDIKNQLPVTSRSLFAIGSATKAFTTFTMGVLVDKDSLKWDTPVREYLPDFRLFDVFASNAITPRDLVTHRSGLPRHDKLWYNNNESSRYDIVKKLRYLEPNEGLRVKFQYNNLMFLTAGYLVEHITGISWENAVQRYILKPLDMSSTNFSVLESQQQDDFALPYEEEKFKITEIPFRKIDLIGPAGSINSNVDDMNKWLIVHLNNGKFENKQIISPSTLRELHAPQIVTGAIAERPEISSADYALGWFTDNYRGHLRLHHGGNIDGFSTMVTLYPNDNTGIVIMVNKSRSDVPEILSRHIADRIFSLEFIDWNNEGLERRKAAIKEYNDKSEKRKIPRRKKSKAAHSLDEYAGVYTHPGYGTLIVRKVKKHLEFTYHNITTPLEHYHYEVFNGLKTDDPTFENLKLQFQSDLKGNVSAVALPLEPAVKNIVFTKKPDPKYYNADYLKKFEGNYDLTGRIISIRLAGNSLKLIVPGQPQYTLIPVLGDQFVLKEYSVISISFPSGKNGEVTKLLLIDPDDVTVAEKKNEQ